MLRAEHLVKTFTKNEKKQKKNKHFFKDFKAELRKVIWPTPKQLVNNTIAVITIVLILAVIVFFLDVAFEALNTYGIDKIRSAVSTSSAEEQKAEVNVSGEETTTEKSDDDADKKEDKEDKEDKKSDNNKKDEKKETAKSEDSKKKDSDVEKSE